MKKMDPKIQIWTCETYRKEIKKVTQSSKWLEFQFDLNFMPPVCASPRLKPEAVDLLKVIESRSDEVLLVGSCCEEIQACMQKNKNRTDSSPIPQCFYMVTNPTLVDHLISQGAYVMTPGWLETWRQKLVEWGFDQTTAREFFHESAVRLTLLDTGTNPASVSQLVEFGAYLDLPTEVIPVGLDFFDLFFTRAVSERSHTDYRQETETARAEYVRQAADSAMAVDLLIQLTRSQSEENAIEQIIDIFTILFSPRLVNYLSIDKNDAKIPNGHRGESVDNPDLLMWAYTSGEDYHLKPTGDGFYLRLSHQKETVGVLHLGEFLAPDNSEQYLNLSLSIAPLCGLAVSNTRIYQKLEEAEKTVRREKEVSETLRQIMSDLSSHLDVGGVQDKLLRSLFRAIPYSHAAIFTLDSEGRLHFEIGMQVSEGGELAPYIPRIMTVENGGELLRVIPTLITRDKDNPIIRKYLAEGDQREWLGVPFRSMGEMYGVIIIGSREQGAFGEEQVSLAGIIADEASIAMENARLFSQVQKMAVTDALTGLFNRRHFYHLADQELKRSTRYHHPLSVIMADIDFFKRVNDTYGHSAGDAVLSAVAESFKKNVREVDVVARYGGEEFVLMLPESNLDNAQALAERIRVAVSNLHLPFGKEEVQITISLGVAEFMAGQESLEALLDRSDQALYEAKRAGRDRVAVNRVT